jgi:hypothetical protein
MSTRLSSTLTIAVGTVAMAAGAGLADSTLNLDGLSVETPVIARTLNLGDFVTTYSASVSLPRNSRIAEGREDGDIELGMGSEIMVTFRDAVRLAFSNPATSGYDATDEDTWSLTLFNGVASVTQNDAGELTGIVGDGSGLLAFGYSSDAGGVEHGDWRIETTLVTGFHIRYDGGVAPNIGDLNVSVVQATVPTPGAAGMLAAGGLLAARRRRA